MWKVPDQSQISKTAETMENCLVLDMQHSGWPKTLIDHLLNSSKGEHLYHQTQHRQPDIGDQGRHSAVPCVFAGLLHVPYQESS